MNRLAVLSFAVVAFLAATGPLTTRAFACSAEDFGAVVDETARALRELNANGAQRYNAKLHEFQEQHNLSQEEVRKRAAGVQDEKMGEFNREIEMLVSEMDGLSSTPTDQIDCAKLEDLKRVRDRLLTVMGQKSGYMLAKVDSVLSQTQQKSAQLQQRPKPEDTAGSDPAARKADQLKVTQAPAEEKPVPPQKTALVTPENQDRAEAAPTTTPKLDPGLPERRPATAPQSNSAETTIETSVPPAAEGQDLALTDPENRDESAWSPSTTENAPPIRITPGDEETTFTIQEIRDAGRGLFGSITSEFAAAINYAFQQFGQPNAYITGNEGGAAFLAGLRYGKGTLYSKMGDPSPIYWQGPSVGYDIGAEGSNTLFLVYNLKELERIYGRFTGVGGSAYVAGGFGVNVLGKGGMVMVPIRTGIGLRLGANLAYLKFTERQTWNPF